MRASGTLISALLIVLAACYPTAHAYQQTGHFYTLDVLLHSVSPAWDPDEARLIAFCAQLPDEDSQLDAISVYTTLLVHHPVDYSAWLRGNYSADIVRTMITVQQLLHGLTGGDAKAVQQVASDSLSVLKRNALSSSGENRVQRLCALGFGLHLYGDAFAHQQMSCTGGKDCPMYDTGVGHARDFHYPDLPLCDSPASFFQALALHHCDVGHSGRTQHWIGYYSNGARLLGKTDGAGSISGDGLTQLQSAVWSEASAAYDWNDYAEMQTRNKVDQLPGIDKGVATYFTPDDSSRSCQDVVDRAGGVLMLPAGTKLSCFSAWKAYRSVVEPALESSEKSRAQDFLGRKGLYVDPISPD